MRGRAGGSAAAEGASEATPGRPRGPPEYSFAQMIGALESGDALPLKDITSIFDLGQALGSGSFGSVVKGVCRENGVTCVASANAYMCLYCCARRRRPRGGGGRTRAGEATDFWRAGMPSR